jgi:hypothetical protein
VDVTRSRSRAGTVILELGLTCSQPGIWWRILNRRRPLYEDNSEIVIEVDSLIVGGYERGPGVGRVIHGPRCAPACASYRSARVPCSLDESLDELEHFVADLPPTAVDRERVSAVRDLNDLGHALVALLPLVRGIRDRPGHGVVLLARDDQ